MNKTSRARIIFVEIITLLLVAGTILFAFLYYPRLPDRIPNHFDFYGMPNAYGARNTLWILPVMGGMIYLVLSAVALVSRVVKREDAKSQEVMGLVKSLLRSLKLVFALLIFYILIGSIRIALGRTEGLGFWSTPVFLIVIIGLLVFYVYRIVRSSR
jgi:uncharacterized membrane protein